MYNSNNLWKVCLTEWSQHFHSFSPYRLSWLAPSLRKKTWLEKPDITFDCYHLNQTGTWTLSMLVTEALGPGPGSCRYVISWNYVVIQPLTYVWAVDRTWNLRECFLQRSIWQTQVTEVKLHQLLISRFEVQIFTAFNPSWQLFLIFLHWSSLSRHCVKFVAVVSTIHNFTHFDGCQWQLCLSNGMKICVLSS
jgi:hypothetical protein